MTMLLKSRNTLWVLIFLSSVTEFQSFSPPVFVTTTTSTQTNQDIAITENGNGSSFPPVTTTTTTTSSSDSFVNNNDHDDCLEGESNKPQLQRRISWIERVHQLIEFRDMYGHTCVPKRYPANPSLGRWVTKQRQSYRKLLKSTSNNNDDEKTKIDSSCSLTKQQIQVLNDIDFCWDPKNSRRSITHDDSCWWNKLNEYRLSLEEDNANTDSNKEKILPWLRQQRKEYSRYVDGGDSEVSTTKLSEEKILALNEVNPDWWKTARQCQWERRCQELVEYRNEHGDCCVPISYDKNKKLANWVSNTRKTYNQILAGKKPSSQLTTDQIEQLNRIGFVWNRWDYEYERKVKRP